MSDTDFFVASRDKDAYGDIPSEGELIRLDWSGLKELKVSCDHRAGE